MYSIVLMMALTTGGETPAFGGRCCGCSSCHSCCGCSSCHGCRGCRKGCHGCCHSCCGCSGCSSCCGSGCCGGYSCGGYSCGGCAMSCGCAASAPAMAPAPAPAPKPAPVIEKKPEEKGAAIPAPATIVVNLPAEAKLTIDDAATRSTSSVRVFSTPTLENSKDYFYTLKAEIVRDGQTVTASKRVAVRAGEETRVSLEFPVANVASK